MGNTLPPLQAAHNAWEIIGKFRRDEQGNGLTHHFLGTIAVEPLCALIPTDNDPIEIFADNGIIRGFDNGCRVECLVFDQLDYLGDVPVRSVLQPGEFDQHRQTAAIPTLQFPFKCGHPLAYLWFLLIPRAPLGQVEELVKRQAGLHVLLRSANQVKEGRVGLVDMTGQVDETHRDLPGPDEIENLLFSC